MRDAFGLDATFLVRAVAGSDTTVQLFDNATCTGTPLATGSAADLATGLTLPVDGQRLTIYANAKNVDGLTSTCSESAAKYTRIEWTWRGGGTTMPFAYDYGVLGATATTNAPRARSAANLWLAADGKIWMFGGNSDVGWGDLNDLWNYDLATGQWTWVHGANTPNGPYDFGTLGVEAISNTPRYRAANAFWQDKDGRLYIFGGYVNGLGSLSDLWRFDPKTGMWTWLSGPTTRNDMGSFGTKGVAAPGNQPRARFSETSWTDVDGNFWMFGGSEVTVIGNDLWRLDPTTNTWTWVSGSDSASVSPSGVYGVKGQADADNVPGGRTNACSVPMKNGDALIFGGSGYDEAGTLGDLNALWRYSPRTNKWTWLAGGKVANAAGVYGTQGVAAATNVPGGRQAMVCWLDTSERFWVFGGEGMTETGPTNSELSDLWMYDIAAGQWTWVAGSKVAGIKGRYSVLGEPDADNFPGGRHDFSGLKVDQGRIWFFGGFGFDASTATPGKLADFWTLDIP